MAYAVDDRYLDHISPSSYSHSSCPAASFRSSLDDPSRKLGFLIHGAGHWTKPYDDFYSSEHQLQKVNDILLTREGLPSPATNGNEEALGPLRLALSGATGLSSYDVATYRRTRDESEQNTHGETLGLRSSGQSLTVGIESNHSHSHVHQKGAGTKSRLPAWISWLLRLWTVASSHPEGGVDSGPGPPNARRINHGLENNCTESSSEVSRLQFCQDCESVFSDQRSLKHHQKTHHQDFGYSVRGDIKRLSLTGGTIRHTSTHTSVHDFTCSPCNKPFTHKDSLLRHVRLLHNESSGRIEGNWWTSFTSSCVATDTSPEGGPSSDQAYCSAERAGSDSNRPGRIVRTKRQRHSESEDDLDDQYSPTKPPRRHQSNTKRPKPVKPKLACPFYRNDPARWHSCERCAYEEISHLRAHFHRKHRLSCSSNSCLPPFDAFYDTRVAKWRAECRIHCHPDHECTHNPYIDGTENPAPINSPPPSRESSQMQATSQRRRTLDQVVFENNALRTELQALQARVQNLEGNFASQLENIRSEQQITRQENLELRSEVRDIRSGRFPSRSEISSTLQIPETSGRRAKFGDSSTFHQPLESRRVNRGIVGSADVLAINRPAFRAFPQPFLGTLSFPQTHGDIAVNNQDPSPSVQNHPPFSLHEHNLEVGARIPQNDLGVGQSTAPTLTTAASVTERTEPRTERLEHASPYVIPRYAIEKRVWTHGDDIVAGEKGSDDTLTSSDRHQEDVLDNASISFSEFLNEDIGDDTLFHCPGYPDGDVGEG